MSLPSFLYIGAPRAGSTWMFGALRAHPEIFVPDAKYLQYFSDYYHRGELWYRRQFRATTPAHKAIGELTTGYLFRDEAIARIAELLPNARLLITLRDPVERDWSAYLFRRRNGEVAGTFREEVDGPDRFISEYSHYMKHIDVLRRYFSEDQFKILLFDDLRDDPHRFAESVYEFLGVDRSFRFQRAQEKAYAAAAPRVQWMATRVKQCAVTARRMGLVNLIARVKASELVMRMLYRPLDPEASPQMSIDDWRYLRDRYRDGVDRLSKYLNRDLSHWLAPPKASSKWRPAEVATEDRA